MHRWLDENPEDELATVVREELTTEPAHYARPGREYLSWASSPSWLPLYSPTEATRYPKKLNRT